MTPTELRTKLREHVDNRNKTQGRNPKHKRTRDDELEFLCGAAAALDAVGHPLTGNVVGLAFLASVGRDPLRS